MKSRCGWEGRRGREGGEGAGLFTISLDFV